MASWTSDPQARARTFFERQLDGLRSWIAHRKIVKTYSPDLHAELLHARLELDETALQVIRDRVAIRHSLTENWEA